MQSAYDYSGKTVTLNGEDYDVPEFSVYEEKCRLGPCRLSYFPSINAYFLNQWEVSILYPSIIIVLTLLAYIFGTWSIFTTTKGATKWVLFVIGLVIYIVWWIAYLNAMFRSAGYLPWYWYIEKREQYTYEEQMGGIITNRAQSEFCSSLERPERAILSTKARRIVLRADHICKWIGNWVGLKNYRYFFVQLIWFVFLFLYFFLVLIFEIVDMAQNGWETRAPRIMVLILCIPIFLFFIFFMIVFVRHIRYLVTNNTTVHELKSERTHDFTNPYDLGCWQNCIETMGPAKYCPIWFLPIPIPRTNDGFVWRRNDRVQEPLVDNEDEEEEEKDPEKPRDPYAVQNVSENEEGSTQSSSEIPQQESSSSSFQVEFSSVTPDIDNESPEKNEESSSGFDTAPLMPPSEPESKAKKEDKKKDKDKDEKKEDEFKPVLVDVENAAEPKGLSMAPPPPVVVVQNETSSSESESEKKERTHDGILDALVDKTIDGEDDAEFDAYLTGEKLPPVPSKEPIVLKIKETNPEVPSRPQKAAKKKKHSRKGTKTVDSSAGRKSETASSAKRVHVKKVKVPVIENGKETGRYTIKKVKVYENEKGPSKSNGKSQHHHSKRSNAKSPSKSNAKLPPPPKFETERKEDFYIPK